MRHILLFILLSISVLACKKADNRDQYDPMASAYTGQSQYCNDPDAINYNHNFPGTANNSTCIFPTDPFKGSYILMDTVYTADYASFYTLRDTVVIYAIDKVKMAMIGLCGPNDSLRMTAGRYYKGSVDTTAGSIGQTLCAPKDTINGVVSVDSLGNLNLMFTLYSDTAGVKFHVGKATKIP